MVREPSSEANIAWGAVNRPMETAHFDAPAPRSAGFARRASELFVLDCFAGADPEYRLPIRVINEYAWHNLFARNLFIVDRPAAAAAQAPQFTVIDSPSFKADPPRHGTSSEVVIAVNFAKKLVLIGGTSYAGEIKKSIFTILNYLLPARGRPARCIARPTSAARATSALFFGLSGTGKTTLSSDPDRMLIGDDEHGWSDRGVFNFEGGCYAKTIRLSARGRAADLCDDAPFRHRPRERGRRSRDARRSISTTIASPRTRGRPIRFRSSTTPCPRGRAGIRRTS